jgi:hypothetical protein
MGRIRVPDVISTTYIRTRERANGCSDFKTLLTAVDGVKMVGIGCEAVTMKKNPRAILAHE